MKYYCLLFCILLTACAFYEQNEDLPTEEQISICSDGDKAQSVSDEIQLSKLTNTDINMVCKSLFNNIYNDSFRGALWYVDEDSCILVKDNIVTIEHNPVLIESEDTRYLLYTERKDNDSEYTYIWTVKDGKPEDTNK